ncbi:hypothetical protein Tco_1511283 [Tanacetum coccineum]
MELITSDLICPSTYQLLRNSGGDSEPDLSFDKSASTERLFSSARVSLVEASLSQIYPSDVPGETIPHPYYGVPSDFNQDYVDRLKAYIVKLHDIPDGVLVRSGVTMREEPHGLDTSILDRVADHTTSPAPTGTAIPYVTLEKIVVTRPDRKVVTKADNAAKRKASTGPKISTNATNKTRSSKKGSGAGSSGQAAEDEVDKDDDGTLNDGDQYDHTEFTIEDIDSPKYVNQGEHINVIPL